MPLIYKKPDGETVDLSTKDSWLIQKTEHDKYIFIRLINGIINETYASVDKEKAAVFAASVILGFQPPQGLVCLDKPAG